MSTIKWEQKLRSTEANSPQENINGPINGNESRKGIYMHGLATQYTAAYTFISAINIHDQSNHPQTLKLACMRALPQPAHGVPFPCGFCLGKNLGPWHVCRKRWLKCQRMQWDRRHTIMCWCAVKQPFIQSINQSSASSRARVVKIVISESLCMHRHKVPHQHHRRLNSKSRCVRVPYINYTYL